MKFFNIAVCGLFLSVAAWAVNSGQASAAACANVSSFGSVTLNVPQLPRTGEYVLWVRMQVPREDAKILAEVNQSECLDIGALDDPVNQWVWQTYSPGGSVTPISLSVPEGNKVRLIGINDGVKVDRVLLTEPECIPVDFGNNCMGSVELSQAQDEEIIMLAPPSENALSGKVMLSNSPVQNQSKLERLDYVVNGRIIQSSDEPLPFDTSLVENGKHTVLINTILQDGAQIKESTVIEIENPENFLTPVIRWIKLNWQSVKLIGLIIISSIAILVLYKLIATWIRRRRERSFHGF